MNNRNALLVRLCMGVMLLLMPIGSVNLPTASASSSATGSRVVQEQPSKPAAPFDVPTLLVPGGVSNYFIADPKVFWYSVPPCAPAKPNAPAVGPEESISRIAT